MTIASKSLLFYFNSIETIETILRTFDEHIRRMYFRLIFIPGRDLNYGHCVGTAFNFDTLAKHCNFVHARISQVEKYLLIDWKKTYQMPIWIDDTIA